jgi:long-chain acyl-CoA synthetase
VSDARTGSERLVAYVVPRAGRALTEAGIAAHLAERLVSCRCPDDVRIVDALPMTGAQKLDRIALRRAAAGCRRPGDAARPRPSGTEQHEGSP